MKWFIKSLIIISMVILSSNPGVAKSMVVQTDYNPQEDPSFKLPGENGGSQWAAVNANSKPITRKPWLSNLNSGRGVLAEELPTYFGADAFSTMTLDPYEQWRYSANGNWLGENGLIEQDINNDGVAEIIITAIYNFQSFFRVLQYRNENDYKTIFVSDLFTSRITKTIVKDFDEDGTSDIYFGCEDNTIHIFNSADFREVSVITTEIKPTAFILGDINGDGGEEFVISDKTTIAAYDGITFQQLWHTDAYGGDLAIGNIDLDSDKEIISSSGFVLNAITRNVEWAYPPFGGFGKQVKAGDVDGDGIDEIVGTLQSVGIAIYEADSQTLTWQISSQSIKGLSLVDVNADGFPEIIFWGNFLPINIYSGQTKQVLWSFSTSVQIGQLIIGDPDQDNELEIICGGQTSTDVSSELFIADIMTGDIEWENDVIDGAFYSQDIGDVDDDGDIEILIGTISGNSLFYKGEILCFNAITHELEWKILNDPEVKLFSRLISLRIGDVDQNGETDFVITQQNPGKVFVVNGRTRSLVWESLDSFSTHFKSLELGDVDADGEMEIVVGASNTGDGQTFIIVFKGSSPEIEWQSSDLGFAFDIRDIHLSDVDADGRVEILASKSEGDVYVFDAVTHELDGLIDSSSSAIYTGDVDQNGRQSIVVGRTDGAVDFYDGETFTFYKRLFISNTTIYCLREAGLNQNGSMDWLACTENVLTVFSTQTGELLWKSIDTGSPLGEYNQVSIGQIDGDETLKIIIGNSLMLFQFDSRWRGVLDSTLMVVSNPFAEPADVLTYTVLMGNSGDVVVPDVQVSSVMPDGLVFSPGSLSYTSGSGHFADGEITWSGDLPAQQMVTLSYDATVSSVPPGKRISSSAFVNFEAVTQILTVEVLISPARVYLPICLGGVFAPVCGEYLDRFQSTASGWTVTDNEYATTGYVSGEYQIVTKTSDYGYLVKAPTCKRQNFVLETDVRFMNGYQGGYYGLLFGVNDDFSKYYLFMIDPDERSYILLYFSGSEYLPVVPGIHSAAIHTNTASNHLKVTLNGSQITLEINGIVLGTWSHSVGMENSSVGLFNMPNPNYWRTEARFDNFIVSALPGSTKVQLYGNGPLILSNPEQTSASSIPLELIIDGTLIDQ